MSEYAGKKVAVVGYGLEGEAMYTYFTQQGADVTIVDDNTETFRPIPDAAKTILGEGAEKHLSDFDIVSRTPPFSPFRIPEGPVVTSLTKEFFKLCPAQIIGVTGTKGKGTTSTLIAQILEKAGKRVHLVGNIGVPAITVLQDIQESDIVVSELSSFQLWDLTQSPHIAVMLIIDEDHLNIHKDMKDYVEAKANIARYQRAGDVVICHPTNERSIHAASSGPNTPIRFMSEDTAHIADGLVKMKDQQICKVSEVGLIGAHNLENICAAVTAAWQYTQDIAAIREAVRSFAGLEHRLEFVAEINGTTYINDSFSAAPAAAMAAIRSFDQPLVLIAGGADKSTHYADPAKEIAATPNMVQVVLIGDMGPVIADELHSLDFKKYVVLENQPSMQKIVNVAKGFLANGGVVLLSPGCASFDMFENFKDRGEQFRAVVQELTHNG